ncbi:hypothetical protein COV18_00405 [Candidatus Woesearchaeota archaeon CG10_big_fil_rev_8_21_14_0_10_37_12]|nr:MAG: hypothetical protein COV18_00405 [Candidatus Woesearchaeota archaeon CG10_big_fil_rev_8_21_14_0_10_37_12]
MKFSISRWHYWWAYLLIIVLALFALWFNDKAYDLLAWLAGTITILLLLFFEWFVRCNQIKVGTVHIEIKQGKKKTKINYNDISDIELRQTKFQKILGFGTICFIAKQHFEVENVEHVNKAKRQIEKYLK